jgi:hypothetical protein
LRGAIGISCGSAVLEARSASTQAATVRRGNPFRPEDAASALAARLERAAVYIGFANTATLELVSKRLGRVIDQAERLGVDLAALCLLNS